jgi:hypothetical protein
MTVVRPSRRTIRIAALTHKSSKKSENQPTVRPIFSLAPGAG